MAARSKEPVYGRSVTETAGSKPARGMNVSGKNCVLLRRVLGDRPITDPEGLPIVVHQRVVE